MTAFAIEWLEKLFGADVKKAITRTPGDAMGVLALCAWARSRRRRPAVSRRAAS